MQKKSKKPQTDNKPVIVFDCYQTLIFKDSLEKTVHDFLITELSLDIKQHYITKAYERIYYKYKFIHPRFENQKRRVGFYTGYNKELIGLLGLEITSKLAVKLNKNFKKMPYKCFPDTLSSLRQLKKQGWKMGVLANWTADLEKVLNKLGIARYLDFIYSSYYMNMQKPDKNIFLRALENELKQNRKIFYIGDDYQLDIIPARVAGLTPILVDRKNSYPEKTDCLKINSLKKLAAVLLKS